MIGIFFVAFGVSGLGLIGASSWTPDVFNGMILVVAAGMALVFARRRGGGPRLFWAAALARPGHDDGTSDYDGSIHEHTANSWRE